MPKRRRKDKLHRTAISAARFLRTTPYTLGTAMSNNTVNYARGEKKEEPILLSLITTSQKSPPLHRGLLEKFHGAKGRTQ
jgi:hypothetical protein